MKDANINKKVKALIKEIEESPEISMKMLFSEILNQFMNAERESYLEGDLENKGNGYYERGVQTGSMDLNVKVPRDREGEFRPQILPERWKRGDSEYRRLLLSLVLIRLFREQNKECIKGIKSFLRQKGSKENKGGIPDPGKGIQAKRARQGMVCYIHRCG